MPTDKRKAFDTLRREIEADTYAARVRDYGAEDAATYEQRVKDGADTVRHLEPVGEEPIGIWQVWQQHGEGYRHICDVEGNYMAAVILPHYERGHPAARNVTWLVEDARSPEFGDKYVDPLGKAYELYEGDFGAPALRETALPAQRSPEALAPSDYDKVLEAAADRGSNKNTSPTRER